MKSIICAMKDLFRNYFNWHGRLSKEGYLWAWAGILAVDAGLLFLRKVVLFLAFFSYDSYDGLKERTMKEESDFHYQFGAQASSLNRRIHKEHGVDVPRLQELKGIYRVYLEKGCVVSRVSPEQGQLLESVGVDITMC